MFSALATPAGQASIRSSILSTGLDDSFSFSVKQPGTALKLNSTELPTHIESALGSSHTLASLDRVATESVITNTKGPTRKQILKLKDGSTGKQWYDMKAPVLTKELQTDLKVLQMRNVAHPRKFYKASDKAPKYFQVGTVVEAAGEFYSARLTNRERKPTMAAELLADSEYKRYAKRRHVEIQGEKMKAGRSSKHTKQRKRN
eukprot:c2824_g1_i1.p1 GENE.c2824_g1_i1~~c2824_g1_i1.p1  ORF type:complete len:203 (+),score=42.28 c2824_g1_i1:32-640(+)